VKNAENKIDLWLISGAERFRRDPELKQALITLAQHEHTRECLFLLETILNTPGLAPRLFEVLLPQNKSSNSVPIAETGAADVPRKRVRK
jgi:hypothetical protein